MIKTGKLIEAIYRFGCYDANYVIHKLAIREKRNASTSAKSSRIAYIRHQINQTVSFTSFAAKIPAVNAMIAEMTAMCMRNY
jgi:hypothetical protein